LVIRRRKLRLGPWWITAGELAASREVRDLCEGKALKEVTRTAAA